MGFSGYEHHNKYMKSHLRAGIAIFNAGGHHGAHDAWEQHWLELGPETDDEQFLHGLIQFTAAVFHARNRNWSGATGLADSGQEYLASLPDTYRKVNVGEVRSYLGKLAADPEVIERRRPLPLRHEGKQLTLSDLDFDATAIAATVLAEEREHHTAESTGRDETELVERTIRYAREDLDETGSPFVSLLFDYVREPEHRGIIVQRLGEHVDRRSSREADVTGLFETREAEDDHEDT